MKKIYVVNQWFGGDSPMQLIFLEKRLANMWLSMHDRCDYAGEYKSGNGEGEAWGMMVYYDESMDQFYDDYGIVIDE